MFPVLFRIPVPWGDDGTYFPIRMFGVMVILGFLAGTWVIGRRLKRQDIMEPEESFDFCFYLLAMGILGSRLMYVAQNMDAFQGKFLKVFYIWEGGLVWYGGFALATLFGFWWLSRKKLPILKVADAGVMGTALALAIGRWGCFCAGDDYGRRILDGDGNPVIDAAAAPWYAVQFPGIDAGWRFAVPGGYSETPIDFRDPYWLHPAQLYMSLANVLVFVGLLLVARKAKRPGVIAVSYFLFYPAGRFVIEYFRGDTDRGVDVLGTGLSFSQVFSIGVVCAGLLLLKIVRTAGKRPPADATA